MDALIIEINYYGQVRYFCPIMRTYVRTYLALMRAVVTWRKAVSMFVAVLAEVSKNGMPRLSA